jgi:hypothetical protein
MLRGGRTIASGSPSKALLDAVMAIPAVPDPKREAVDTQSLQRLGYQEP